MNNKASIFASAGIMVMLVTVAQLNGHVTPLAFYQIVGSIVGTLVLSTMFASFK